MNLESILSETPSPRLQLPVVQLLIQLVQDQSEQIAKQNRVIQDQSEQIAKQNRVIQDQSEQIAKQNRVIQGQSEQIAKQNRVIQGQSEQIAKQNRVIQDQSEQIANLKQVVDELKDQIAELTKTPKRPKFGPGGMEPRNRGKGKGRRGSKGSSSNTNAFSSNRQEEEIKLRAEGVPKGSRFKGYQTFVVQDVEVIAKNITYKLEVWLSPDGKVIRAKLPKELRGKHQGVHLRAFVINLYAQGMTQPAILDFIHGLGLELSTGQLNNILLEEAEGFAEASEEILQAGLEEASYIRTDDTGEKHLHRNGYCTHIGGEYFAYYKTTFSKSRSNFLNMLLQGKKGYFINEAMIWHLFQCGVSDQILNIFEEYKGKKYSSKRGLHRLLNRLGLQGKKIRSQCCEAALVGFISEEILKSEQVLLSDRAGQFAVFNHAACWIHMERPLRKVIPTCKRVQRELKQVRGAIWALYKALKERAFTQSDKEEIYTQYDDFVSMKSTSSAINAVIDNFRIFRDEMLKALDHPDLPLHNNDSERDIRGFVKRRKISGSTKSEQGRQFRDGLASLKQTCFHLGYSFWEFSLEWFRGKPPNLAKMVRERYRNANATA